MTGRWGLCGGEVAPRPETWKEPRDVWAGASTLSGGSVGLGLRDLVWMPVYWPFFPLYFLSS